jgi:hypothetical protein
MLYVEKFAHFIAFPEGVNLIERPKELDLK